MPATVGGALRRLVMWARSNRTLTVRSGAGRGLRFYQRGARINYASGSNELPVQQALADLLRPGAVFYDVGANIGFLTVIAARLVGPTGRVLAFEPVAANAAMVRRNAALNGQSHVTVVEAAAARSPGRVDLTLAAHPGGAALASVEAPPDAVGRVSVEGVSIDAVVASGAAPPPAVVKIDVEGAEFEVLAGMENTVRDHRPTLLMEFDDATEEKVAAKVERFQAWASERGYGTRMLEREYVGSGWCVVHVVAT